MKQSSSKLVVKSFAKLNLYLQVLNKRRDNFHNLNTLFCRISLADTISLKNRQDGLIKIKCDSRQVPRDETNLCWRAAALLKQEYGVSLGVDIEIKKRIPVGAGLGGGSSNAASVLLGLNRYWSLNLTQKKLASLGARLGSDVPFFIYDTKFALGRGRGDKIKPLTSLNKLKLWFILIYPKIKVSTPEIYQRFDTFSGLTRPRRDVNILVSELLKKGKRINPGLLFNDLAAVTTSLYPVVDQVKVALAGVGLDKIMMSGSGPAVFALCDNRKQALNLKNKLARKYRAWAVFVSSAV